MKMNTSPRNTARMGGVSEVGEFRINNSAKAFGILSSGLYANKIRAIIRELSCNAVDSHVEAGRGDIPFDIHLPSAWAPWFSIRDYGTGLTHDQVLNVYTTYFESTKTESNDFVGALGLGSKSPFSYSDNFSVTAIRDGVQNVYSAFINDQGVPSVAHMSSEATDEPPGVEVRMSVDNDRDFSKFRNEASTVFTHFALRPNITSDNGLAIQEISYVEKDLVPGVHHVNRGRGTAVMGGISYPIDIPNSESNLGPLLNLLNVGIEIHFELGEIEFQPSREGLSYTDYTIRAIRKKLLSLNNALSKVVAEEANKLDQPWEWAEYLVKKSRDSLWEAAVLKYASQNDRGVVKVSHCISRKVFELPEKFFKKLNINFRGFMRPGYNSTISMITSHRISGRGRARGYTLSVNTDDVFVINDEKVGCLARAKFHYKAIPGGRYVYTLDPIDKSKPMRTDLLFQKLKTPNNIVKASTLNKQERKVSSGSVNTDNILWISTGNRRHPDLNELRWVNVGEIDDSCEYFYLPMSGFQLLGKDGKDVNGRELAVRLKNIDIPGLSNINVHGVRKGAIDHIQKKKNWINIQEHITKTLTEYVKQELVIASELSGIFSNINKVNKDLISNQAGDCMKLLNILEPLADREVYYHRFLSFCEEYAPELLADVKGQYARAGSISEKFDKKYPLLTNLDHGAKGADIIEYINLIEGSNKPTIF